MTEDHLQISYTKPLFIIMRIKSAYDKSERQQTGIHIRQYFICLFPFLLVAIITGCSSIDCPVQNTVYTVYRLYDSDGIETTLGDTLTIYTTRRNGTDSILLNRSLNTKEFNLPISYNDNEDTLFFEVKNKIETLTDTVYINKDNYPHFESVDCNASFFHDINSVKWTRHAIDSIAINKKSVNYDSATEHFHIYFKNRN